MLSHYRHVPRACQAFWLEIFKRFSGNADPGSTRSPKNARRALSATLGGGARRLRRQRLGMPGADPAFAAAHARRVHRRVLAGPRRHDLGLAVAVEVRQPHSRAVAAGAIDRDLRGLVGKEALAVAEEDPGRPFSGQRHEVEIAVAVEIADPQGVERLAALDDGEGAALPLAARPRVEDVDAAAPGVAFVADVADGQVGAPV